MRSALERLNGGAAPNATRSIDDLQRAAAELDRASDGVANACLKGGTHTQLIPPARALAKAIDVVADATATAVSPGGKQASARGGGGGGGGASANKLTAPVESRGRLSIVALCSTLLLLFFCAPTRRRARTRR